MNFITNHRI